VTALVAQSIFDCVEIPTLLAYPGVQVAISDVAGGNVRSAGSASITVLDSPASTSALDYNVQFRRTTTGTGTVQGNGSNSSITLLEIGA
jgi:type 1 fimbria pilin